MVRVTSFRYQAVLRILLVSLGLAASTALGQDSQAQAKDTQKPADTTNAAQGQPVDAVDPLKRPLDAKKRKQQQKDFSKEIKGSYKKWLDEDVVWIISDEERVGTLFDEGGQGAFELVGVAHRHGLEL